MSSQEKIAPCPAVSPEIKGGTYGCLREEGHEGVHMAESGDDMDYGFYPANRSEKKWEIVIDVKADLLAAERRLGRRAPSEREKAREAVIEAAKRHMDDLGAFEAEDGDRRGHAEAMDESAKELVTALEALAALGDA